MKSDADAAVQERKNELRKQAHAARKRSGEEG